MVAVMMSQVTMVMTVLDPFIVTFNFLLASIVFIGMMQQMFVTVVMKLFIMDVVISVGMMFVLVIM